MKKKDKIGLVEEMNKQFIVPTWDPFGEGKRFVYALILKSGRIYIGQSRKVQMRIEGHFGGHGGKTTREDPPVGVAMITTVPSFEEALHLEEVLHRHFNVPYGPDTTKRKRALMQFPKEELSKKELWGKHWWPATQNDDMKAFTNYYNQYRKYQRGLNKLK